MEVWDPGPASAVSLILSQDDEHDDDAGGDDDQDDVGGDNDSGQRWGTFSSEDYDFEDNSGAKTKTGLTQQKIYIYLVKGKSTNLSLLVWRVRR